MSTDDIAAFSDSMAVVSLVNISGSFSVPGQLVAIAEADNSVRAVATRLTTAIPNVPSYPFAGLFPFSFLIFGNADEEAIRFVFQLSDPSPISASVVDLAGPEVDFSPDADVGTYELPLVLNSLVGFR
jgi:hypothetical protein